MAVKPSMHFIATTSNKLPYIEVKAGQLIFCSDTRAIYLDVNDERTPYQSILNVADEEARLAIESPFEGYYYVMSTNTLWSYFGEWIQMTGQEEPNIIFIDGDLPYIGIEDVIYVKNDKMYRWNGEIDSYYRLGGNDWENYSNQSI